MQYKQLKKQIKRMHLLLSHGNFQGWNEYENQFAETIKQNLRSLNETFLEKEEHIVMRLDHLEEESQGIATPQGCALLIRRFVDFHGEIVLFMHWSLLAYTGMVKILKKHHKKTGATVQSVHTETLVTQPFYSPEVCQSLIQRVETAIRRLQLLYPKLAAQQAAECATASVSHQGQGEAELAGQGQNIVDRLHENLEQIGHRRAHGVADITHQTQVALATWERLRSSAATPSTVLQAPPQHTTSHSSSQGEQDET